MSKKETDRISVLTKLLEKRINNATGAKMIGVSVRHIKRIKKSFQKKGPAGLMHKSRGRPGHNRLPKALVQKTRELLRESYADFKPTMACEKLEKNHQLKISKETVRQLMMKAHMWIPRRERAKAHFHSWRERKEQYGDMEQYDGSKHDWFEGRLPVCTLLAAIDDATGKLTHAKFASDEGVVNTFLFWWEYMKKHGKPLNVYLDRFSTYKVNYGDLKDDPSALTQFQRAMEKDLKVKIIHANSPQAKGRIERVFQTLQERLPKEMRLEKIYTIGDANKFLTERFIPEFNEKFAVVAKRVGDLHRTPDKCELKRLNGVLSIQTARKVNNDFTVSLNGIWYQLEKTQPTLVLKKDVVIFEEHVDGTVDVRKGEIYLHIKRLPERPRKEIDVRLVGLTKQAPSKWKPPLKHPWRKQLLLKPVKL
jgi:transposase